MTSEAAQKAEPRFKLYSVEELDTLPDPEWLISGLVPQASLAELYGRPEIGKSFLALDWGLCMASGVSWLGRDVAQADVVYVCAEGGRGIKKRIAAWCNQHPGADVRRFKVLPEQLDVPNRAHTKDLAEAITEANCDPGLIVIDTLARCFGGGDENSTQDMNAFVAGCDRLRAAFPNTTVLVVHHIGKDPKRGDRGNTALRGAADTLMELAGSLGRPELKCSKQKDWERFEVIPLKLRIIPLGPRESSCVFARFDPLTDPFSDDDAKGNESDVKALEALKNLGATGATYTDWCKASGLPKATFKNALKRLLRKGHIEQDGKLYRVADGGKGQGQGQGQPGS